ncbi:S1 family peptidase [Flocculibacter collagenilyticus]|uniref:S1 family peptidase n=1 Tax=Flocculibacter collagenilyticus TaxID=2744479 RepID=UPI0018F44D62|nr:trypsin-like serine protease [Flocculibacter collagenilyticus]
MRILLFFFLFCIAFISNAVVIRHDIPSKNYKLDKAPEYLIDMPHEGHGVLISPQWILTVAHTIFYDYSGKNLKVGSKNFEIEKVYIHRGYVKADKALFEGDATPLMNFLKSRSDIALIKLSRPVTDLKPIDIYPNANEKGKEITVFGRGAKGDGITGENIETKSLRELNHFKNIVETTDEKWLSFKFDKAPNALPLEGMHGSGDSGGASIIFENGTPYLVGLSSWQLWEGDLASFKGGLYGTTAYQVRVSKYRDWIMSVLGS